MRVHPFSWVSAVMVLLVLSVGVNVLQARRIWSLIGRPAPESQLLGKRVGSIQGVSLDGQPTTVSLQGSLPTVLYHFSSTCAWCERNWQNLEAVAQAAAGRYQVIAVTTEKGVQSYVQQRGLTVRVIEQLDADTADALQLTGTPRTLAIGTTGIVTHEWVGAYISRNGRQVEELFGVNLPGLLASAARTESR